MATPTLDRAGPSTQPRTRPRYARLATFGMGLLTASMATLGIPAFLQIPDARGFVLVVLAVSVAGTALVWRSDALWARLLSMLACAGVAVMMFWTAFGLLQPQSFFEFVTGVTFVLGVSLALTGNILAIVQRRRGNLETTATSGERHVMQIAAGIVALAVVGSSVLALTTRESVGDTVAANAAEVEMSGFEFTPQAVEVVSGDQLVIRNRDAFMHDFSVPDLGIDVAVNPGSSTSLNVDAARGSYVVYCSLHSDTADPDPDPADGMVALLTVR
jgi:plastocyanin